MFNSKEYEWSNVQVLMLGRPVTGIRGVSYKTSQEKEVVYARGSNPRAIQRGNKSYEGTLTLLQSELEALLLTVAKGKSVCDIPAFDIVVSYAPETGGTIVTDLVKNAEFTDVEKMLKQGDKFMEIELPFIALGIKYTV